MKELTSYISWLSNSVYSVYTNSFASWISNYSDQPYFSRAYDRMAYNAALSDYTDINAWAEARILAGDYYETQAIPPEYTDVYYYAAEKARATGMIRKRMAFKRPPYQGLEDPGGPTAKQRAVRRSFKKAVDRFNTLNYTSRSEIYDRAIPLGFWYYNFLIEGCLQMIKSTQWNSGIIYLTGDKKQEINPVDIDKSIVMVFGQSYAVTAGGYPYPVPVIVWEMDETNVYLTHSTTVSSACAYYIYVLEYY